METMTCYRHPNRETRVSCSECGRGICPDCMVYAPVGIRCPDHAGVKMSAPARAARGARRTRFLRGEAPVTKILVAINVLFFLVQISQSDLRGAGGWLYIHGALLGSDCCYPDGSPAGVAHGEWWRLVTAMFLHSGLPHIALNMLALWWVGRPLEEYLGTARYLLLYFASGLAGSAGALLMSDANQFTVGASGAIFGLFGALIVMEQLRAPGQIGPAFTIVALNMLIPFVFPSLNISIGGHLGGLVGGALGALALSRFGRGHVAYGRPGLVGMIALVAIGVGSIALSYWRVRGYT